MSMRQCLSKRNSGYLMCLMCFSVTCAQSRADLFTTRCYSLHNVLPYMKEQADINNSLFGTDVLMLKVYKECPMKLEVQDTITGVAFSVHYLRRNVILVKRH